MHDSAARRRHLGAWLACLVSLAPVAGSASDGVIELNQTCATQTGCTTTDTAGFPITLGTRGSYRLTSTLTVPNQNTNGIEISDADIHLDFNGFTLLGPGTVPVSTHICTFPGTGSGIAVTPGFGAGLVVQNGHVRGMGNNGIDAGTENVRVERMIVSRNCGTGIRVGSAGLVIDSQVRASRDFGILANIGSRVRDSVADQNGDTGILAGLGSVVTGSVATANGTSGVSIVDLGSGGAGGVIIGNSAAGNGWGGLALIRHFSSRPQIQIESGPVGV